MPTETAGRSSGEQVKSPDWIWDPHKADLNKRKHLVSFELAALVFADPFHLSSLDPHETEHRWRTVGMVGGGPVFRELYQAFKGAGDQPIEQLASKFSIEKKQMVEAEVRPGQPRRGTTKQLMESTFVSLTTKSLKQCPTSKNAIL